jgi:hypothetical protein
MAVAGTAAAGHVRIASVTTPRKPVAAVSGVFACRPRAAPIHQELRENSATSRRNKNHRITSHPATNFVVESLRSSLGCARESPPSARHHRRKTSRYPVKHAYDKATNSSILQPAEAPKAHVTATTAVSPSRNRIEN